ncbi:MAG TPA: MoxR family ATPase [Candidatus Limnocylindria bacterium]|jgi:MoxR-like ATPase|nr:MoxR family ATPase [Candidatus Limnocylindria bacterium]
MSTEDVTATDSAPSAAGAGARRGARFLATVEEAVANAVVGSELPLRLMATALLAGGHALVEDVPGVGKTLLARAFARSLGLSFARVQGTPDLLPTDVTGSSILEGAAFRFIEGPVFANVLLVDEINRATPRTQSALLEAMQERQVSAEGQTRPLPDPFLVLATQNPIELEGTFALPEAQLDRFLLRIAIGYPDEDAERRIARRHQAADEPLDAVPTVVRPAEALALRAEARAIHVSDDVERYAVALVRATRDHADVRLGASPRSSVALYRVSQAWALLDGRDYVLPDDVQRVAPAVLEHRLLLDVDRELRGASVAGVVRDVIASVPVPMAGEPGTT